MSLFTKIIDLANVSVDNLLMKARTRKSLAFRDQKAYEQDPSMQFNDQGWKERFTPLDFDMMQRMSKDSIVSAIIQTRTTQACSFCRPQKTRYDTGYKINLRDQNAELGQEEEKEIESIYEYLKFTGVQDNNRPHEECETFANFVMKTVKDRLIYDQVAIEIIPTNDNRVHHFVPVDASTIRLASDRLKTIKQNFRGNLELAPKPIKELDDEEIDKIKYVQVFNGRILTAFNAEEMVVKFGNPTNNIRYNGYSEGELERLVNIITAHLHAENHNKLFFTHGQAQKGILHIKGSVRPVQLEAFRRHFQHQAVGHNNAWRTPIIAGTDEVRWIDLSASNRDMEFTQWMNYLIKIICAIFQIDPEEINFGDARFKSNSGQTPMFMSMNESRIKNSQDRGLRPILHFLEEIINDVIFKRQGWSDKYVFEFVGLNAESIEQEIERHNKEVQSFMTIDEVRKNHGLEPLTDKLGGHLIQNATYLQWLQQFGQYERQAQQEAQQQMQGGEEDSDYDFADLDSMVESSAESEKEATTKDSNQDSSQAKPDESINDSQVTEAKKTLDEDDGEDLTKSYNTIIIEI